MECELGARLPGHDGCQLRAGKRSWDDKLAEVVLDKGANVEGVCVRVGCVRRLLSRMDWIGFEVEVVFRGRKSTMRKMSL